MPPPKFADVSKQELNHATKKRTTTSISTRTVMTTQSKTIILTFVRHGQTDANFKRIIDGQGLVCPLNDVGLQQSKAAGKATSLRFTS